MPWLDPFCRWLAATPLSVAIGSASWVTPIVQSIHILAVATVVASALMMDMKILGVIGGGEPADTFARRYLGWIWVALIVLLLTGALLITGEPKRSLENVIFVLKMALLLIVASLTALFHWPLRASGVFETSAPARRIGKVVAALSLVLWASIVFCGRWIAYAQT
jgi:hypothetical protein